MNPETFEGAAHIVLLGMGAALIALAVSVYMPSIIPQAATKVQL